MEVQNTNIGDLEVKDFERLQLIVFELAGQEYACNIDQIKEIVITPHIATIPLAPPFVLGVSNIRGNIITIIDLEERLGLENQRQESENLTSYTMVAEHENLKLGVITKKVPTTLQITSDNIEQTNANNQDGNLRNYMIGLVKKDNRLIVLLDLFKLISKEDVVFVL